jgi:F0F1-type ATP synthase membrane subunit c/vacuolar-type H+-ATPase subunit K
MTTTSHSSPDDAIRVLRLIGLALGGGVTMFAVVAWLVQQGAAGALGDDPLTLYLWLALTTSLAAASLVAWRGMVVPHLADGRAGHRDARPWQERAGRIQSGVIITWALVEAAALFGVIAYFLDGRMGPAVGGVALMWSAIALTWPRTEWLATTEPASRR